MLRRSTDTDTDRLLLLGSLVGGLLRLAAFDTPPMGGGPFPMVVVVVVVVVVAGG